MHASSSMQTKTQTKLQTKFMREVAGAGLRVVQAKDACVVSESDLTPLPESVRRYLRFMGVVGRPRDVSLRAHFRGRFRLKPGPFMNCEAWQFSARGDVARIFFLRMRYAGVLPLLARDTYRDGHGRMLGKIADLFTIVDGTGAELDTGELVTYLNDAILMAPSLVLGPETTWSAAGDDRFDVAFTDQGRTVRARVTIGADGAPKDFSTTDRYYQADFKSPMQQTRWSTPIDAMQIVQGRSVVQKASAVWHLESGPFSYAELELDPSGIAFNVMPGT